MKVHDKRSVLRPRVTCDGEGLVSHAGTSLLSELADRSRLTKGLSAAMAGCGIRWRKHDPGYVLTHLAVAIADGADCLSDMDVIRQQSKLFGPVASQATAWRAVEAVTAKELRGIMAAITEARAVVWAGGRIDPDMLTFDFDATLVDAYSEKQDAKPTYKKGFGFHPFGVWLDETSEPLAAMLRPGNAGANNSEDHIALFEQAVAALPPKYRVGHGRDDNRDSVACPILVRVDSAGASHRFVDVIVDANTQYSIGYPIDERVRDALNLVQEEHWVPAVERDGTRRDGAYVTELTDYVDLDAWRAGCRLICRRERPHPGAQLSVFDDINGYRHTCFITNTPPGDADTTGDTTGDRDPDTVALNETAAAINMSINGPRHGDIANLELRHRGHARVEDRIRNWKDCGLANFPFEDYVRNQAWLAVSLVATALLAWTQLVCLTGPLTRAEPKTIRYRLLHVAARLATHAGEHIMRIDRNWPWRHDLAGAYTRLRHTLP